MLHLRYCDPRQPRAPTALCTQARMSPGEVAVAKGNTAAARALYDAGADMADPDVG